MKTTASKSEGNIKDMFASLCYENVHKINFLCLVPATFHHNEETCFVRITYTVVFSITQYGVVHCEGGYLTFSFAMFVI